MATQQLLEKFEAICSPDSVFCLYTGLIERLVATNQALTVSDVSEGLNLRALDLELAIVDILRLLQSTRRCWRDSTEKLGQSTALCALREFVEVPQRAKFVLGLHDRVDALVSSCGEAVGDLEGIKKGVDLWSRDCKRQLHYFTTAVAIGDEKGVFASQLKEAAGLGLVSELQELWELASFWMKQPARLTAGEQQLLNRVAQVMAEMELFKDYEGVDTLPAGLQLLPRLSDVADQLVLEAPSCIEGSGRSRRHGYAVQSWQSIVSRFQLLINEPFNRLASNRAVRLAVGRKSAQSVYELHRELDQLVSTTRLEKLVEAAATKDLHRQWETQWYTLRRQQAQVLCEKASDISAVLKELEKDSSDKLDSGWARHVQGFWAVLEFERLRHPIKYTAEELGTIKRAASDIADTLQFICL
ncbi:hypothetical protein PI126_g21262 [Phytophthora idaei]|nr:hypothetical protein PI126_g21262 [Phytophthora idaei]